MIIFVPCGLCPLSDLWDLFGFLCNNFFFAVHSILTQRACSVYAEVTNKGEFVSSLQLHVFVIFPPK